MKKRKAIQAMLDGKKVKHSSFSKGGYVCMDDNCLVRDDENDIWEISEMFIDGYSLYQEPLKTESWAKYTGWQAHDKKWIEFTRLHKDINDCRRIWTNFSHHTEIPNSRVDLPVVKD